MGWEQREGGLCGQVQAALSRWALVMPDTQGLWSKAQAALVKCCPNAEPSH